MVGLLIDVAALCGTTTIDDGVTPVARRMRNARSSGGTPPRTGSSPRNARSWPARPGSGRWARYLTPTGGRGPQRDRPPVRRLPDVSL